MKELLKAVHDNIIPSDACKQGVREMMSCKDEDELAQVYVKYIDFILKYNLTFPQPMLDKVGMEVWKRNGVFFGGFATIGRGYKEVVLNGNCRAECIHNNASMPLQIYVRHTSSLDIMVEDGANVWIYALDYSLVRIKCDKFSKAHVYNYGRAHIIGDFNVAVKENRGFYGQEKER